MLNEKDYCDYDTCIAIKKMKRKYEVRWYKYNLTEEKRRKFFTHWGAMIFMDYLEAHENAQPVIYKI